MMVVECPDCGADFATDEVGKECPECGGDLTSGAIKSLDFLIQCQQCEARIGVQNIDRDDVCPECGGKAGFVRDPVE